MPGVSGGAVEAYFSVTKADLPCVTERHPVQTVVLGHLQMRVNFGVVVTGLAHLESERAISDFDARVHAGNSAVNLLVGRIEPGIGEQAVAGSSRNDALRRRFLKTGVYPHHA